MPFAAPRPCPYPGCGVLGDGPCAKHRVQRQREVDSRRGNSNERLYTAAWRRARAAFLRAHPLCQCPACDEGRLRLHAATVVDHKVPHRGDRVLFWDRNNWQSMTKECHDAKTAREDGGFGNTVGEGRSDP